MLSSFKEAVPFAAVITLFLQFFHGSHKPEGNNPKVPKSSKLSPSINSPGVTAQPQLYLTALAVQKQCLEGWGYI